MFYYSINFLLMAFFIANTTFSNTNKIIMITILNSIYLMCKIINNKKNNNKYIEIGTTFKFILPTNNESKYTISKAILERSHSNYGDTTLEFKPNFEDVYVIISKYIDNRDNIRENVWNIKRISNTNNIGFVLEKKNDTFFYCVTQQNCFSVPIEIQIVKEFG
jgi:hypothetical protein